MKPALYAAITGNILFILWILFNGLDEGWKGATPVQIASYTVLTILLGLNSLLLAVYFRRNK